MRRAIVIAMALGGCAVEGDVLTSGEDDDDGGGGGADPAEPALCGEAPPCPAGRVCGRIFDVETSRGLTRDDGVLPRVALVDQVTDAAAAVAPDACGYYAVSGTGDLLAALPEDATFLPTYTRVTPGSTDAFALRRATEARWSAALGAGALDGGALLLVFVDTLDPALAPLTGTPVAGVAATGPATYFEDADPRLRSTLDPARSSTMASGAALIAPVDGLTAYTGISTACGFGAATGAEVPGALQVVPLTGACAF